MAGKKVGLVIGNNYPEWDKERQLKFAVADAKKIKEILENKEICGFDEVIYLPDEKRSKVAEEVEKIFLRRDVDLIFIYFSGHGKKDYGGDLCLLLNDTKENTILSTSLTFDFINRCRGSFRKSVIIVLDCCYSGAAKLGDRYRDTDVMDVLKSSSALGTIILSATGSTGSPKAKEDEELGHGVFTNYLIEGLEKGSADENRDGLISITELFDYASKKIKESNSPQSPKIEQALEGVSTIFIGIDQRKIKEKEYELKKKKLYDKFEDLFPTDILGECQAILRKYYRTPSPQEKGDKIILGYIESLLKNNLSPEKRDDIIQNLIEAVQDLKGICRNELQSEQKEVEDRLKQQEELRKQREEAEQKQKEEKKRKKNEKEAIERKNRLMQEIEELSKQKEEKERKEKEKKEIERKQLGEEKAKREEQEKKQQEEPRRQREEERKKKDKETSKTFTSPYTGMEFVLIPPGRFIMGSNECDSEKPAHIITIKNSFYIGKYPVTQKQWKKVMGNNPSYFKGEDRPVEMVSWEDAHQFIIKLNEKEGTGTDKYRLPSEAEWEYACRASTQTRYFFGDDKSKLNEYAWYAENSGKETYSVGLKKPNPWGLYDMHGNVWEWVQDRWHENYNGSPPDGSAREDGNSSSRVIRGGGWNSDAWDCRSANRDRINPDVHGGGVCFRIICKTGISLEYSHIPEKLRNIVIPNKFISSSTNMEFILIPDGKFMMGSPLGEEGRNNSEGPLHKVTVKNPFYLGKYPVTQKQWEKVMGNNPSDRKEDDLPVKGISWYDAQEFIEKLNEKEGTDKYRLPSEAEWEYACRAGTATRYFFGNNESELKSYAWFNAGFLDILLGRKSISLVGKKSPNPWGLYDMYGNIREWVQDNWHDNYTGAPADSNAWEVGNSSDRVNRGGHWFDFALDCRSASRFKNSPSSRNLDIGFRLLKEL